MTKQKAIPQEDGETDFSDKQEIDQDDCSKYNPVPTERFEVVAFQVTDQELDGDYRNQESSKHARQENSEFKSGKIKTEFDDLQKADPEHNWNAHEEGKFRRDEAGSAQHDAPQNGRTGARCTWNDRECLEQANLESFHIG